MIGETRADTFLRVTGEEAPATMLRTTGQLLYKIWELEREALIAQEYLSTVQTLAGELYQRD